MNVDREEAVNVTVAYLEMLAIQLVMLSIQLAAVFGAPYLAYSRWNVLSAYVCGVHCPPVVKGMWIACTVLALSMMISTAFMLTLLVNLTMRKKMKYVEEFFAKQKNSKE